MVLVLVQLYGSPDNRVMKRLAQLISPVALAIGLISAAAAVALAIRGPITGLDLALTVTAVAFVSTTLVGMAVLRTSPANPVGWILLVAGAALPVSMFGQVLSDATYVFGRPAIPGLVAVDLACGFVGVFAIPLVGLFGLLLFPDGRLTAPGTPLRRRTRWLTRTCWVMLAGLVGYALFSPSLVNISTSAVIPNPIGVPGGGIFLAFVLTLGLVMAMTCAHLCGRVRAAETPDQRRALTLAAVAAAFVPAAFLACLGIGLAGGDTAQVGVVENIGAVAVAAASWYGIIRYGLFDSRAVLSRTLLYGSLTVVVVAVYLAATALLRRLFAGDMPAVVAAGLAALAVLPLRDLLQRRVNRLVFGLRDDPVAAFGLLGVRLDAAAAPEEVLPAVVRTVGEALRLRCVSIEVGAEETARWGQWVDGARLELDLPFAGESIGRLTVQSRDPGEPFGAAERSLLESLARQVSVAARAVALTQALQSSRERLVATREEERRRLRRDLHDGLGPTLAGIALGIDTARRALPDGTSPGTTDLLTSLREEAERAVTDIRRIAYNLRPPVLDERGLVGAIREHANRVGGAIVVVPVPLPPLPAAVEVAAYRIAVEAMTNASRHAPGTAIEVSLSVNGRLELQVADAGAGLPPGFRAGVGLRSMRERAAELGGECELNPREPHGTVVRASLPLEPVAS
jgi:two-component system NarL family sensor kinase